MNDYSEITYGKQCLENILNDPEITIILKNVLKPFINIDNNLNNLKEIYHLFINDIEKKYIFLACLNIYLKKILLVDYLCGELMVIRLE